MDSILFAGKIVFSIFLPLWLYRRFGRNVIVKRSNAIYNIPSVGFLLKRWWAEYCIVTREKKERGSKNCRIKDKNSVNSLLFYGTDQQGNSLFVQFSQRGFKTIETSLRLTTSDGHLYVLPAYPDTTSANGFNEEWTADGFKIELLEAEKRWRIIYNGMLRNLTGGESTDENIEHIRLNFLFVANSSTLKWPGDWSPRLHAEALAREPWRSPKWINKIDLLDRVGSDHFGSMLGQVTRADGLVSTFFLRGLHQHRWGQHESREFNESVTLFGVMPHGALYYLDASDTKHSFPRIVCGQFRGANEIVYKIDKIEMKLPDSVREEMSNSSTWKMCFSAKGRDYDVVATHSDPVTLYYGQPWDWMNVMATVKLTLNGKSGTGLIQLRRPYTGPCRAKTPVKTPVNSLRLEQSYCAYVRRTDYVVRFEDGKCRNEHIVGGKGSSLATLTLIEDADFTVPKGFCVTIFALDLQLRTHRELQKAISDVQDVSVGKKEGDLEKYCDEAVRIIRSTPIVDEVKDAISKAMEILEEENDDGSEASSKYAIRSSAVGEDGEDTSAAGQNSTYLGVRGKDNVVESVAKCWASLFSYRSVEYRKQHGLPVKSSMGVCVQKMVNADAAGVMFTRHPNTGDPSSILITSNYGLGETVVSATVDPDTIIIHRSWKNELTVKNSIPGDKNRRKMLVVDDGLITSELSDEESKTVSISEQTALRLAAIGMKLEIVFNGARDVEWAVIGEKIYLLQARPITILYSWTEFELIHELDTGVPSDIDLTIFSNVGEVFPNPVSPLTLSIFVKVCNEITSQTYHKSDYEIFHVVGMRIALNYYNTFLRDLTNEISMSNKVIDMAICGSVVVTPEIHRFAVERHGVTGFRRKIGATYKMVMDLIQNASIEKIARETCRDFTLNPEDFHTAYSLYNEINEKYPLYAKEMLCHSHTSRVSTVYQILTMSFLTKGHADFVPDHFSDVALLLGSSNDVVGTETLMRLEKIINYIKKSELDETFRNIDPTKAIGWLKMNCPLAAKELENLLTEQGHRYIQEMDFLTEPWSLKPENLIITLQALAATTETFKPNKTLDAEETVARLKTPNSAVVKFLLRKLVPHCRKAVARRESTKSSFVHVVHKFRLAYKRLGKLMVMEEYIPNEDLVFFLTKDEIGQVLNRSNSTLVQKAIRRKRIFPRVSELQFPEFNVGMPIPIESDSKVQINGEQVKIQGTPICGGSVLGRACVITDFSDARKIQQNDILITRSTDIAWSPYFPLLSGIVTEMGGLISHGAVIAREYGLSCIISAREATKIFRTGDTVLLAADAGILHLVKKFDEEAS